MDWRCTGGLSGERKPHRVALRYNNNSIEVQYILYGHLYYLMLEGITGILDVECMCYEPAIDDSVTGLLIGALVNKEIVYLHITQDFTITVHTGDESVMQYVKLNKCESNSLLKTKLNNDIASILLSD